MDVVGYRNSGELSDITVVVDSQEFNLHKFPLFVRSNYFKNLSSLSQPTTADKPARVELENFPGGPRTFAIIADYCYNKEVNLNSDNVIDVRCAAEYLEMTGGAGRGGLVMLADNVLFDLIYSAKAKRDYHYSLNLLDRAAKHFDLADKSGINQKLVDSFAENLSMFVKTSSVYDSFPLYNAETKSSSSKSLHRICLTEEDTNNLNDLPLKWMNDLVKTCAKSGLHQSLLSYIIQNYIDHNTGLNYKAPEHTVVETPSTNRSEKPTNLIAVAADILKAQNKLADLAADQSSENANKANDADDSPSDKPTNLIDIAGVILKGAQSENKDKPDQEGEKPQEIADKALDLDEKPANLISIASVILSKKDDEAESKPNENDEKPTNLVNILGDILKTHEKLTNTVAEDEAKRPEPKKAVREPKRSVPDEEKIKILSSLTKTLQEAQINPQFPINWLLFYMNALHELNAEPEVKSAFHKWTWNSLNNIKSNSNELSTIPPSVMVQLAQDVAGKDETDRQKLVELTEKYIADLDNQDKLDLDTFKQLISCIPKEERSSFDNLMQILLKKLNKDKPEDKEKLNELLSHIDFSKLNEKTLDECKKNGSIPLNLIAEAALNLCHQLRKELDDAKLKLKSHEIKSRPYVSTSANRYSNGSDNSYSPASTSAYNMKYSSPSLSKLRSNEATKSTSKSTDIPIITASTSTTARTASPAAYQRSSTSRSAYPSGNAASRYNYTLKTPHLTYSTSASRPSSSILSSTYRSNFNPPVSTYYYHHQQEHYYESDDDFLCDHFDHNLNDEDVYDYYSSTYSYSKK